MTDVFHIDLMLVAYTIAVVVSYAMFKLAGRVYRAHGKQALSWLVGGGMAMGTGMWGMHFIVLLAYHFPVELTYNLGYTELSWVVAMITSGFGLWLIKEEKLSRRRWLLGGIIMGCGMLAMHYVGMAAMEVIPRIRYISYLFAASIVLAIGGAIGMVWCAFYLRAGDTFQMNALRIGAALIIGLVMTVMYSAGTAAAHLSAISLTLESDGLDHMFLAFIIASFTLITLDFVVMLAYIDIRSRRHADALKATLKTAHSKLAYLGTHDVLTSLPNRLLLSERITQALMIRRNTLADVSDPQTESQKIAHSFALLHISIDRLKTLNEALGRDVGDQVLSAIVLRIRKGLTPKATLARISGSEFVALVIIKQTNDAAIIAEKIINTVSAPLWVAPHEVQVTLSIGISVYCGDIDGRCTAETLLGSADTAMEYVKQHGRNNYQFFTPEMQARHRDRVDLESGLRPALRNQEFLVYYQPKINFVSGKIVSVEALLRWQHPEYGLISPERFIPLAEESGLITSIGNWVLEAACQQSRAWQDTGLAPICIAVNLSAHQFLQRDLVENIVILLARYDIAAEFLALELTEGTLVSNPEEVIKVLQELARIGVQVAIDDFGTGYSSLSYLRQFPLTEIKIDRSFIQQLEWNQEDRAIVYAIIVMAHNLHLIVVAEGVATEAQRAYLEQIGCDQYQGYLFSPPVPAQAMTVMLQSMLATSVTFMENEKSALCLAQQQV